MSHLLCRTVAGKPVAVPQYHLVDLAIADVHAAVDGNPFDVDLWATFRGPEGTTLAVPGFYDHELGFVVRFSPQKLGRWTYETTCSQPALRGIHGAVDCTLADEHLPHGPLRLDARHPHHFLYADGSRCFLMGYECNWLMMVDQESPHLTRIEELLDDLVEYGFNMVTVNGYAYIHPGRWDPDWQKSGDPIFVTPTLSPWAGTGAEPDYQRLNPAFFAHCDRVMLAAMERGLLVHLMIQVYNKGIAWPEMCSADDDRYWRYFMARYQAFGNVILDPAKETFNRPADYVQNRIAFMRSLDGHGRLMTVHDPSHMWAWHRWPYHRRFAEPDREAADDLVEFKSDQIHLFWYEDAVRNYRLAQRPYVNIEYGYERGVQEIPTNNSLRMQHWREVLRRTWLVTMGGGYINYYYVNTAWTVFIHRPIPPGYAAHRIYREFWESTDYWRLAPDNAPLAGQPREVYCRCDPEREYVVFDEAGKAFEMTLAGDSTYSARWLNPVGGEYVNLGDVASGRQRFDPPFGRGNWAVLHVRRR